MEQQRSGHAVQSAATEGDGNGCDGGDGVWELGLGRAESEEGGQDRTRWVAMAAATGTEIGS